MIVRHDLGRQPRAIGQINQHLRRLLDEIEGAGNDVAVGRDDQPRRWPGADQQIADGFQAAQRFDANHAGGNAIGGRFHGGFFAECQIVGCAKPACKASRQR